MSTTPNMGLDLPDVQVTPGPTYAQKIDSAFQDIDLHDHSANRGVKVPVAGLNINADLPLGSNNLNAVRGVRLDSQSATPSGAFDIRIVYSKNGELAYRDAAGNEVIITSSGSVAGASGTITGLSSPAASTYTDASKLFTLTYDSGKFARQANGDILLYPYNGSTAYTKAITIKAPVGLEDGSSYSLTLPSEVPASDALLIFSTTGVVKDTTSTTAVTMNGAVSITGDLTATGNNQGRGFTPVGGIVATFPNITGTYTTTATTTADTYGWVKCNGQTISDAASPMNGQTIPNINNSVFLMGNTTAGSTGGANTKNLTHTHTVDSHSHNIAHVHQFGKGVTGTNAAFYSLDNPDASITAITTSHNLMVDHTGTGSIGTGAGWMDGGEFGTGFNWYTAGVISSASGSGSSATSGTASPGTDSSTLSSTFDIRPAYITAVYLMRIK